MTITKSFLQHELQNILMIIGFQVEDLKSKKKKEILDSVQLASLLVEYENLFLGKRLNFFCQKINLSDIWEILINNNQELIQNKNIQIITKSNDNDILKIDRDYILKALNQIFILILKKSSQVKLIFHKKTNTLTFQHNAGFISEIQEIPIKQAFQTKENRYFTLALQTSLRILKEFKSILTIQKNTISILFP